MQLGFILANEELKKLMGYSMGQQKYNLETWKIDFSITLNSFLHKFLGNFRSNYKKDY